MYVRSTQTSRTQRQKNGDEVFFNHFSSIAHERLNVDDVRTMILIMMMIIMILRENPLFDSLVWGLLRLAPKTNSPSYIGRHISGPEPAILHQYGHPTDAVHERSSTARGVWGHAPQEDLEI